MKKQIAAISLIVSIALSGCAFGAPKISEEAQHVIDQIDTFGEVTMADRNTVYAVFDEYSALTKEQKEEVSNFQILADAKKTIHQLEVSHPFALFDFGWDTTIAQDKGIECKDKSLIDGLGDRKTVHYTDCTVNGNSFHSISMRYEDNKLDEIWIIDLEGADKVNTYYEMFHNYYGTWYRKTDDTDNGYMWMTDNCTVILDAFPSDSTDHSLQIMFLPPATNDAEIALAESKFENMVSSHEGLGDVILEMPDSSGN